MSPSYGCGSVSELASAMRGMQLGKMGMVGARNGGGGGCGNVWGVQMGSPRSYMGCGNGMSLPTTPTRGGGAVVRSPTRCSGLGFFDPWEVTIEEEVPMERVESGKDLRARMYARLSKENSLVSDRVDSVSSGPDFGWVSELVQ